MKRFNFLVSFLAILTFLEFSIFLVLKGSLYISSISLRPGLISGIFLVTSISPFITIYTCYAGSPSLNSMLPLVIFYLVMLTVTLERVLFVIKENAGSVARKSTLSASILLSIFPITYSYASLVNIIKWLLSRQVTVAIRGLWLSSASSPKAMPSVKVATVKK